MARKGRLKELGLKETESRPIRWRKYPYLFLIVCEDQNTEKYYFESFIKSIPEETIFLRTIGTGRSSLGVVEQAVVERNKLYEESNKKVDATWAVFDKDDAEKTKGNLTRLENAFLTAQQENISVAYSNEVFELWLLLHLIDVNPSTHLHRKDVYNKLEVAIKTFPNYANFRYFHGNTDVIDIIQNVGIEKEAIKRAEILITLQEGKSLINYSNPSTTVYRLVVRLRELIEFYEN